MEENQVMNWDHSKISDFQMALVFWYEANKRLLPWRENTEAYRVWVSEVMLQQTRVDTVIPYYERFMASFPTMKDFAYADEAAILKAWEGLGYYSRVRNLQIAMRQVIEEYHGTLPNTLQEVLKLKGVGPYTAGALLSICYELPEPAVDGNVMRVISRVFEIDDDIMKVKTRKKFETMIYQLIDSENPGAFNQGLMEIGALVCTPKKPMCLLCPVQAFCAAHREGKEINYPVKIKKVKSKRLHLAAVILNQAEQVVVEKRASGGLLANLWQFPTVSWQSDENREVLKLRFLQGYGLELTLSDPITSVKHIFSHLVWEVEVFQAELVAGEPLEPARWMSQAEMASHAFPVPYQKMWQAYLNKKEE
ncbi:A/G-specific adenine glycosylase [Listeria sp. PSOL-1]|uniref:A/G-specific adenine glycosylase n=1 Tax=Listeria sp. PSOL-1 TaxID=1844999 RepID=UPI0013D1F784|nr:A/G-specific adenine glycosylase [Listeria sp. PSOL-1]